MNFMIYILLHFSILLSMLLRFSSLQLKLEILSMHNDFDFEWMIDIHAGNNEYKETIKLVVQWQNWRIKYNSAQKFHQYRWFIVVSSPSVSLCLQRKFRQMLYVDFHSLLLSGWNQNELQNKWIQDCNWSGKQGRDAVEVHHEFIFGIISFTCALKINKRTFVTSVWEKTNTKKGETVQEYQ